MILSGDENFIFDKPQKPGIVHDLKKIITSIQSNYCKRQLNRFPHVENKKKYYVSICGIFKNEAPYLKEWIEYHRIIGVDHIYLYNNNSDDAFLEVIDQYIKDDFVTLVDWPYNQKQMESYKDCANRFKNETYWLGFIDIDEFIVPVIDDSIKDFFRRFHDRPSVLIYWRMFGTSGIVERDVEHTLVTESFTSCWPKYDDIGKCFLNTNYAISDKQHVLHHMLWTKYEGRDYPPVNCYDNPCPRDWFNPVLHETFPIQINHYVLKSKNEYLAKTKKSDVFFQNNPKGKEHFERHEKPCTAKDDKILKYIDKLKKVMEDNKPLQ